jgi:hypothetical protein
MLVLILLLLVVVSISCCMSMCAAIAVALRLSARLRRLEGAHGRLLAKYTSLRVGPTIPQWVSSSAGGRPRSLTRGERMWLYDGS